MNDKSENKTCYFQFNGSNEKAMAPCCYDDKPYMCKWASNLIREGKPKIDCRYYDKKVAEYERER